MSVSDRAIATSNKKRHDELCREVSKDLSALRSVGGKLLELHELGVFKDTHKTFEIFVRELFNLERQQAYRLMDAARVVKNLSPIGDKTEVPKLESQLREVAKAPPEKQAEVVTKAIAKAAEENRKPTAKDFKQVVGEIVYDNAPPKREEKATPRLSSEEQIKAERKKARSYAEYLQRSIDDLHRLKRNKALHPELIELCGRILKGLEQW